MKSGVVAVFSVAMLKFLFAYPVAIQQNLSLPMAIMASSAGMMTTVCIITFFSKQIKAFFYKIYFNKRNKFTKSNRTIIKIYSKFGLWGIAFATPPLLTPIGGTLVAVTRGEKPAKILLVMLVSSLVWGIGFGIFTYFLKGTIWSFLGWS